MCEYVFIKVQLIVTCVKAEKRILGVEGRELEEEGGVGEEERREEKGRRGGERGGGGGGRKTILVW